MDAEHREETGAVAGLGFGVRGATFTPCAFASCWYGRSDRPKPDNPAPLGRPCRSRPLMTSFGRRVQKVGRSCCSPGTMPAADCRENGRARLPTFDLTVALLPRGHRFQLAISTPPSRLTAPSRLRRRPRLSDIGGPERLLQNREVAAAGVGASVRRRRTAHFRTPRRARVRIRLLERHRSRNSMKVDRTRLFRETSLDRLSTSERLDRTLAVSGVSTLLSATRWRRDR